MRQRFRAWHDSSNSIRQMCVFVCPDEPQYNQAGVGLFVWTSSHTIRQMAVCMSGRVPIQSGRCPFVCPDEFQYNQAEEDLNAWREVY